MRGPRRHFTHSKVMAWVALDRAVRAIEKFGLDGPLERWSAVRQEIHDDVCRNAFDAERNSFTQSTARTSWTPACSDPAGPLPARHRPAHAWHGRRHPARVDERRLRGALRDQRPPTMACRRARARSWRARSGWSTTWPCSAASKRRRRCSNACSRCATMLACWPRSTTTRAGRMVGNFPQAFTHVGLVNSAYNLDRARIVARQGATLNVSRAGPSPAAGTAGPRSRHAGAPSRCCRCMRTCGHSSSITLK